MRILQVFLAMLLGLFSQASLLAAIPACIPSGIQAWWSADGDAVDQVNGHSGALQGGVTFSPGKVGQAFNLDGSTGRVAIPNSPLWNFGSNDFTIDLWMNLNAAPSGGIGNPSPVFLSHDNGPTNVNKWVLSLGGGILNFQVASPSLGPVVVVQAPFVPLIHQWYHLALTRSGTTERMPVSS